MDDAAILQGHAQAVDVARLIRLADRRKEAREVFGRATQIGHQRRTTFGGEILQSISRCDGQCKGLRQRR